MLRSLKLTNFRSYKNYGLSFTGPTTVVYGPNAVGKTNLLESIFVITTSKSFRSNDEDLINRGSDFFRVEASFTDNKIELSYQKDKAKTHGKKITINNKKQTKTSLLGINPVTLFEPHDLLLLSGSPQLRRRYLNIVISQIDKNYVKNISLFRRLLKQRNHLLYKNKKISTIKNLEDQLFIYDLQISGPAQYIRRSRISLALNLSEKLTNYYKEISAASDVVSLTYRSAQENQDDYLEQLKKNREKDKAAGFTLSGPHRDDLAIVFKSRPISTMASRGEARTAVLALKLAEMDYMESIIKKRPLLLLDDVFSELDSNRRGLLFKLLNNQQTIITTTDLHDIENRDWQLIDLSSAKVASG